MRNFRKDYRGKSVIIPNSKECSDSILESHVQFENYQALIHKFYFANYYATPYTEVIVENEV